MTYEERESIFSKEVLRIEDIQALFDLCYSDAAEEIRTIRRKIKFAGGTPRVDKVGRLHIQDYLDYYKLPIERYIGRGKRENETVQANG